MKKIYLPIIIFLLLYCTSLSFAICQTPCNKPNCTYYAKYLTGGASGSLDKIDGDCLISGDIGIVVTATNHYFYTLKTSSCGVESSPSTIVPDVNAGSKCWSRVFDTDLAGDVTGPATATVVGDDSHSHTDATVGDIGLGGDLSGTTASAVVGNDSHSHTATTISDSYLKNSGGDVGTGDYTFTGNVSVGDGDADNPKVRFIGTTIKEIYFDQTRGALILNAGKVIIE